MSAEQFMQIVAHAPEGVCMLASPSLRVVAPNQAYASLVAADNAASLIGAFP